MVSNQNQNPALAVATSTPLPGGNNQTNPPATYPPVPPVPTTSTTAPTPVGTYQNMFSTSVVRSSSSDVNVSHFTRAYREKAKDKEHLTLVEAITKPLPVQMTHLDFSKLEELDEEVFVTNEKLENFMIELSNRLSYYGMSDLLQEHIILGKEQVPGDDSTCFDPSNNVGEVVDFTKKWDQTGPNKTYPPEKIAEANAWKLKYTKKEYEMVLKDGKLLHDLLVKSMSQELKDTVMSELHTNYQPEERSGSLTFVLMLQFVINLSKPAIEGLKRSLEKQTLKNIPGQNVYILSRRVSYGLDRLRHNNAFPHDVENLILDMMMTSSVPEFNNWIAHWKNTISFTDSDLHPSYQTILKKVVTKYQELCVGGMWNGTNKESHGSVFKTEAEKRAGELEVDDGASAPTEKKKKSQIWSNPTSDELTNEDPPQYSRVIKKKVMMWCAKCNNRVTGKAGRWNTSHYTDGHSKANPRANVAGDGGVKKDDGATDDVPKKNVSFKDALLENGDSE